MALNGVHILFGNVRTAGVTPAAPLIAGLALASQTMSAPGVSAVAATANYELLSIAASAPIFYAVGSNPDASGTGSYPRHYYDPATGREDLYVNIGDKVAWVFA